MSPESLLPWVCGAYVALSVVLFFFTVGSRIAKRVKRGSLFPDRKLVSVLFEERWTSGNSHKSLWTKYGGASHCLRVAVTDSELWMVPHFPVSIIAEFADLEHRIKKEAITCIDTKPIPLLSILTGMRTVVVEFLRENGEIGHIELHLRRPGEFLEALDLGRVKEATTDSC